MPASERKIATMLFADLVGSTQLASDVDPEHTRVLLDRFYDAMSDEIEGGGGTIEKFVGDAVLAVFGVPVAHEDHAERALHTALAMRARLRELFGERIALRIGVNTGEVVVGPPRAGSSFVSGDTVNVTARLEQGADAGEILVGERTAAAAGAAFEFSEPVLVEAKGKEGGVAARRLLSARATTRPRGVLGEAFVGRVRELGALEEVFERVVELRRPQLAAVVGDPGVGKSTLLRELAARLAEHPSVPLVRSGRCPSYGRGLTYRPLADVLRQQLGVLESDSPDHVLELLEERTILGLSLGLDVTSGLHPLVVRERFHAAWIELAGELARHHPLVLVVEDVHWAEEPLLELLAELRRRVDGPLLLVTTARPEAADAVSGDVLVDLGPLEATDAGELMTTLLGEGLPAGVRDAVARRSEGNPFFIEELLASLIDRGVLERASGGWRYAGSAEHVELPDTVQAVLAARLDLLPEIEKRALQTASVLGRVFWAAPVRELAGRVEPDFGLLERRSFIRARASSSLSGEQEYAFRHQLTREVAYSSLPKADRGRLHAAAAQHLERGDAGELASLVAHHYEQSVSEDYAGLAWLDEPDRLTRLQRKAVHWLQRAADAAASRYDMGAAVSLLERALELAENDAERFELWRRLADVQSLRYDTRGFVTAMESAIALAPDDEAVTRLHAELALRSCTASLAWNPPLSRDVVEGWTNRAAAGSAPSSRERAMALIARAWHAYRAEDTAREALAIAERVGDPELVGWALRVSVIAATQAGRYDVAAEWSDRTLALLGQVDDPGHRETLIENTALRVAAATGRFDDARRLADLVSEIVQELPPHSRLHGAAYALEVEELTGNWERVHVLEPSIEQAVDENRDTPCVRNARTLLVCALGATTRGDEEEARRFIELASAHGIEGFDRELAAPRLRMALLNGRLDEARRLVEGYGQPSLRFSFDLAGATAWLDGAVALGLDDAIEREAPALAVPGTCLEPFALRALGRVRRDRALLDRADLRFAELGLAWHAEH